MDTKKISLAIVDDHQLVIDGIKSMLEDHHQYVIAVESTNPLEILGLLQQQHIDILLTDIMMPGMNGDELSKKAKAAFPSIKILALSMSGQGDIVNKMISDADISGYVLKNIGKKELLHAIDKIASGGVYFSEEVLAEMIKASEISKENETTHLTRREIEIIALIEKEYGNKQIADSLFLSERTIETHRKNIFRKTHTSSALGLIKYAYEHKLI